MDATSNLRRFNPAQVTVDDGTVHVLPQLTTAIGHHVFAGIVSADFIGDPEELMADPDNAPTHLPSPDDPDEWACVTG